MDKTDKQIINCLVEDGSIPFSKVAKKIGISTDTVIRRYNALKKEGVIKRAMWNFDFQKCGIKGRVDILIRMNAHANPDLLAEEISCIEKVFSVAHTEGDYDILAIAHFEDYEQLDQITNSLSKVKEILCFDVCICSISRFPNEKIMSKYRSIVINGK